MWYAFISDQPSCKQLLTCYAAINAIFGQDVAIHGYYTEPATNITLYTSSEPNGTVVGDGFFPLFRGEDILGALRSQKML
jgi:hypothetical protein